MFFFFKSFYFILVFKRFFLGSLTVFHLTCQIQWSDFHGKPQLKPSNRKTTTFFIQEAIPNLSKAILRSFHPKLAKKRNFRSSDGAVFPYIGVEDPFWSFIQEPAVFPTGQSFWLQWVVWDIDVWSIVRHQKVCALI